MVAALPVPVSEHIDPTRRKIIEAAGEIFADNGFQSATVRDICAKAGSNVASVNYHFGDKAGLYIAVLREATGNAHADMIPAGSTGTPQQRLQGVVFAMCRRMLSAERPSWALRLMAHEMARPTGALDRVVAEVIQPAYLQLRKILGELLGLPPGHKTTRLCVHSIIAQIIHYKTSRPVISRLWPDLKMTAEDIDMLAHHIYEFSICSVRNIARKVRKLNAQ